MARQPKLSEIKFPVTLVDGVNIDGEDRQALLYDLAGNDPKDNILQYHRAELRENGHQVIEVMVNNHKIGEVDDNDYIRYQEYINSARGGRVAIYQEEDEDGKIHCTCDSFMIVPYVNSEAEKKKLRKRKQIVIAILCLGFMVYGIKDAFTGKISSLFLALLFSAFFVWYGFIRDPKKDDAGYQFFASGKRNKMI